MTFHDAFPAPRTTNNKNNRFFINDIAVPESLRQMLIDSYPSLKKHRNQLKYWRTLRYLLFPVNYDRTLGTGEKDIYEESPITMTHEFVAACWNVHPKKKGFTSEECLHDFSDNVFPLEIIEHRYIEGRARAVVPYVSSEISDALSKIHSSKEPHVYLVTGKAVTTRSLRAHLREAQEGQKINSQTFHELHPAKEFGDFLNEQSPRAYQKAIVNNIGAAFDMVSKMPLTTSKEIERRNRCLALLHQIKQNPYIAYTSVEKTHRIFSVGATANCLPSEIRKVLFQNLYEIDLHAAQLAIVAKKWEIPELLTFLQTEANIWQMWADYLDEPLDNCKGLLKTTIYSLVFGMGESNARCQLRSGESRGQRFKKSKPHYQAASKRPSRHENPKIYGLGKRKMELFFEHPIVVALLEARARELAFIQFDGGAYDAFNAHWTIEASESSARKKSRSILAAVVQSYEMRLMLAAYKAIQKQPTTHVVSFLHDGLTIDFGDAHKRERHIAQIQKAVKTAADDLGIPTKLTVKRL
jgi:hypothetical protein